MALAAKSVGAEVVVSEINDARRTFAAKYGIATINPLEEDLPAYVQKWTGNKGAEVVFEVSGVQPAIDTMTEIAAVRGRICVVAIHSDAPKVDLFKFFWKELELFGARVYEYDDFEMAIDLLAKEAFDIEPFITSVTALEDIGQAFSGMDGNPLGMKALISCNH